MSGCSDIIPGWGGKHSDNRGFSLTELIVVMGIFLTVMLITSSTFKIIANSTSQQSKSAETQIEGVVGLEVLRADLEQAGFGLPWSYLSTLGAYQESVMDSTMPKAGYWPSGDPSTFNDSATQPPRPILSANTNFNIDSGNGAKYIAIKSMTAATNGTAKKWTNVSYTGGARTSKTWGDSSRDFAVNDWVVAIKNNLMTAPPSRQLKLSPAGNYYVQLTASANLLNYTSLMSGHADGDTYQVYGVAPGTATPRMPFNRADYYVLTPATKMPEGCAPHTGVLYKANITHATSSGSGGGGYAPIAPGMPLLDCVADMQIVYGLDTDGGGRVNSHIDTNDPDYASIFNYSASNPAPAQNIRNQVREIRVYILTHDGKKDVLYTYPSSTVDVGESFDGTTTIKGRRFNLSTLIGTGWQNYRWKVYTIVVRPKNLIQ